MILKCDCCSFEQEFKDGEEAFQAGWDAPPHFTGYIACNLCPAVCIVLNLPHTKAHSYFSKCERPAEFNQFCLPDKEWAKGEEAFNQTIKEAKKSTEDLIDSLGLWNAKFHAFIEINSLINKIVPKGYQFTNEQANAVHACAQKLAKDLTSGKYIYEEKMKGE